MKFPHTHFTRGTRLRIVLRDGTVLVRKFRDRLARSIVVTDGDTEHKIQTRQLKSVTIYKGVT